MYEPVVQRLLDARERVVGAEDVRAALRLEEEALIRDLRIAYDLVGVRWVAEWAREFYFALWGDEIREALLGLLKQGIQFQEETGTGDDLAVAMVINHILVA